MLCGGEALPRDLADRLLDGGGALWNMYGPTETTVWSSCGEVLAGNDPITIGRPIANTQLHVLDRYDQPVPFGVPGQLHIGGDGVAKGYFRQDELTAEKFIPDPFKLSARLYRTGDVARRLPSGEIQVLGRADTQIKLRGFRIELEEIEAVLSRRVGPAAVALREDTAGKPMLVGYLAGALGGGACRMRWLRTRLAEDLPDYMIPSVWVRLDSLPVTPNGKLDRAALPAPDVSAAQERAFAAPETPLEASLASIWAEVLKVDRVEPRQRPVLPRRRLDPSVPDRRARQSAGASVSARGSCSTIERLRRWRRRWRRRATAPAAAAESRRQPIAASVSARRERAGSNMSRRSNDRRARWRRRWQTRRGRTCRPRSKRGAPLNILPPWRSNASGCWTSLNPAIPR